MLNNFTLQGRLCADPDLRTTQTGVSVCSFRIAWSEKYKETETKLFMPCTAWRGTGELISRQFTKGKEILVEGKLSTKEWEDKDTGGKRSGIEMTVERVHFCGSKQDGGTTSGAQSGYSQGAEDTGFSEVPDDGELPF